MKTKNNTQDKQFRAIIGIDLGDAKYAVCVTDKGGNIVKEYSITNNPFWNSKINRSLVQ